MHHPTPPARGRALRDALPALLLAVLSVGAALPLALRASAAGPVAAVFPPWWDGTRTITTATLAGAPIRPGGLPFVVVVAAEDAASRHELRRAGAWLLLDPRGVLGCLGA